MRAFNRWKPFNGGQTACFLGSNFLTIAYIYIRGSPYWIIKSKKKIIKEKLADILVTICNLLLDVCLCCSALETFTPIDVLKGLMNSTFLNLNILLLSIHDCFYFNRRALLTSVDILLPNEATFWAGSSKSKLHLTRQFDED